jgi:aminodeoxyfutalosine deaminase
MPIDLVALPKVELHVHLEGTITAATAIGLAERHGEDPNRVLPLTGGRYPDPFDDFRHFVEVYLAVTGLVRTPDDMYTVVAAFAEDRAAQNIVYSELTYTALTQVKNGMEPGAMWDAISSGLRATTEGARVGLIIDTIRDLGKKGAEETLRLVENADAPIVGLGLTGVEGSMPERDFKMLRDAATSMGFGFAVHAGETGTSENVRAAVDDLGADRIGHGVATVEDPALVERLARDAVPLEVCPSSNVAIQLFPSLAEHPFPAMWRSGLNVTVNSDDPAFFSSTLSNELEVVRDLAMLEATDLAELQRRAMAASFTSDENKRPVIEAIDAWERSQS